MVRLLCARVMPSRIMTGTMLPTSATRLQGLPFGETAQEYLAFLRSNSREFETEETGNQLSALAFARVTLKCDSLGSHEQ